MNAVLLQKCFVYQTPVLKSCIEIEAGKQNMKEEG